MIAGVQIAPHYRYNQCISTPEIINYLLSCKTSLHEIIAVTKKIFVQLFHPSGHPVVLFLSIFLIAISQDVTSLCIKYL